MSINAAYLEKLNNRGSRTSRIFLNMVNLFSKKSAVIQIGIGGFSSSGKTVLIDAIFALFDKQQIPGYLPKNFKGGLYSTNRFKGAYSDYASLRADVSVHFHTPDHATFDNGIWNENTHCAKLHFCNKEKILLIRNLPGEMFRIYFEQHRAVQNKSIKTLFHDYIESKKEYKKIYRNLFKFELPQKDNNSVSNVEKKMTEIREAFIKEKLSSFIMGTNLDSIRTNFFAFLFYITSDFNVYCIKSKDREEEEIKSIYEGIIRANQSEAEAKRFMICFTQFDRIFNQKMLPQINNSVSSIEIGRYYRWKNIALDLIGYKKDDRNNTISRNSELVKYWLAMNTLYQDIQIRNPNIVEASEWENLKDIIGKTQYNWFISSVAYNFSKEKFYAFQNQDNQTTSDIWNLKNNNQRTPIGVLELMLYILSKSGLNRRNSHLPLPETITFNEVTKKIDGNN